MVLVFSDLHLGRFPNQDDSLLHDLNDCLQQYSGTEANPIKEIIFLGDVFDAFMEYPDSIPEIVLRFAEITRALISSGVIVSYLVGNHDPWHLDFFDRELSGNLFRNPLRREIYSRNVFLSHGDEFSHYSFRGRFTRHFMRSQFWYRAYTKLLPSSTGQAIPAWVSRNYAGLKPRSETITWLRRAAQEILSTTDVDLIILGHAHQSTSELTADGQYINSGSWLLNRSYVEISSTSARVRLYKSFETVH